MEKLSVAVIGATGMVGQRLISLLDQHPWFEVNVLAASARSAGKRYQDAVGGRWAMKTPLPDWAAAMTVQDADDVKAIADRCRLVFCAVSLDKKETQALEERLAQAGLVVVSNNSACRGLADVPMLIPEINFGHMGVIPAQQKRLGTKKGFIVTKPNCSIQSYVPALTPLLSFGLEDIMVTTYQAVSGAGRTLTDWPEMADNVIPYIGGEEEKSEHEPLKIWGRLSDARDAIMPASKPRISAQCLRVPVEDGHMAAVSVRFAKKPSREDMLSAWREASTWPSVLSLPHAPQPFLHYFDEDNRPQTRLDRDLGEGMAIAIGRLRPDPIFDWKFVCLSHNTVRGAAGGSLLTAEMLYQKGYVK